MRIGNSNSSIVRNRQSSHPGRRRSTVLMNLQLNDPTMPPPAEVVHDTLPAYRTASPQSLGSPIISSGEPQLPQHFRAPSLGEIHQELEQEQEAQVNRLLQMIRTQQQQLQQLQAASGQANVTPPVVEEFTPTSERSMSFSNAGLQQQSNMSTPRSPVTALHPRSSFDLARADLQQRRSRTPSRTASPRLRSTSISGEGEAWSLGGRDESAFYQAETQMMIRENQMLRQRIRELERQVSELHVNSAITHEPATPSTLLRSESVSEESAPTIPASATAATSVAATAEIKDE
ncbi:hypothetical protein BDZ45DRAFT_584367 [Acephala macrosclerotiorum]|nr:hypothetical protein BDZ45DRAFT_584367 [Acephala macrosclerotiorum]